MMSCNDQASVPCACLCASWASAHLDPLQPDAQAVLTGADLQTKSAEEEMEFTGS